MFGALPEAILAATGLPQGLVAALGDRYAVLREIGRGGMATVYLADDLKHGRRVAVKVLHEDYASVIGRARFLREIAIASRLSHPGIIPLFDSGVTDAVIYYVMPYEEGETLRDRLDREVQLPLEAVLAIVREVGEALAYAHEREVIHRDVKPANILLAGGHALVADFGIARAVWAASTDQSTSAGLAVGTPQYMSPEQAAAGPVDQRTDIWALGCVVYEMLAGSPPFTGATPDSIFARARSEPPPSLEVVRPAVGPGVRAVVEKALARVPADRYQTVEEFVQDLQRAAEPGAHAVSGAAPAQEQMGTWRRRAAWLAGGALALGAAAALAVWAPWAPRVRLDPLKIVVFPLADRGDSSIAGSGSAIASVITSALETAEPLTVAEAWNWLSPAQRHDATLIAPADVRRVALSQHARFALGGWVLRTGDSARVALVLRDLAGDSLLPQVSQAGLFSARFVPDLGLRAASALLSRFLTPGRPVDLRVLLDRNPSAIVSWTQGERHYRGSRFGLALDYYQRALTLDSALVIAALKGALAANWLHRNDSALVLVNLALRRASQLPARYRQFASGLRDYLSGSPDSALASFQRAIAGDSSWVEAWMALGEVHLHYLMGEESADTLAGRAFERVWRLDPEFTPAIYHLSELAIRSGRLARADTLLRTYRTAAADSAWLLKVTLMLRCARDGPRSVDWAAAVREAPGAVLQAARMLASGGVRPRCAEPGFRAVLALAPPESSASRFGALTGLQALLVAEGRQAEVPALLAFGVDSVNPAVNGLYVVDAAAGLAVDPAAAGVIASLGGETAPLRGFGSLRLWYHGLWAWHRRDTGRLAAVVDALERNEREGRTPADTMIHDAMAARLALLRGDTARALTRLQALRPRGGLSDIAWEHWAPLGEERLLLAQLLLARGEPAAAARTAALLDLQEPIAYLLYLAPSLEVRLRAAEGLGHTRDAALFRDRLSALRARDAP